MDVNDAVVRRIPAFGWVLREIWKHDPDAVRSFVAAHVRYFSIEAGRNALKYASPDERVRSIEELKGGRRSRPRQ